MAKEKTTKSTKLTTGQREWLKTLGQGIVYSKELSNRQSAKALDALVAFGFAEWSIRARRWKITKDGKARLKVALESNRAK